MNCGRTRVIFTGAAGSLAGLGDVVQAERAQFTEWPLVSFTASACMERLEEALHGVAGYAAVCLTSPRAARAVARLVAERDIDLSMAPVLWTSPACELRLRSVFPRIVLPPPGRLADGLGVALARTMLAHDVGSPVLFPCGDQHRDELLTVLGAAGRVVETVEAYRTVLAPPVHAKAVVAAADIVVVTSPGVARLLASVAQRERPALVAIGPTTADAATAAGWAPDAVAECPAVSDMAAAVHSLLPSYS